VFGGNPQKLFELARKGDIELLVSASIVLELATILRDKFSWSEAAISDAVGSGIWSMSDQRPDTPDDFILRGFRGSYPLRQNNQFDGGGST